MAGSGRGEQRLELRGSGVSSPGRVTVLAATPDLVLGEFRCAPDDELWQIDNEIGDLPHVVWPLTPVEIRRGSLGAMCADPNTVVLYDAGTRYRRRRLAPMGDRALFLALRPWLLDLLPCSAVHPDGGRFAAGQVRCSARSWLGKERVAAAARVGRADAMRLEEMALSAAYDVLGDPASVDDARRRGDLPRARGRVEHARMLLGQQLDEPLLVAAVAKVLQVSPFHLARQFRAMTGTSMYAYRQDLRVRSAVQRVLEEPGVALSAVAVEQGFGSHSHFSASCRRTFGCPPSALRARVAARHVT